MIKLPPYMAMEHKFADITAQIGRNGIYFDRHAAYDLINDLRISIETIDMELVPKLPKIYKELPYLKTERSMQNWIASGKPYRLEPISNTFIRWSEEPPNPNSSEQLRNYLLSKGWKPREDKDAWNFKKVKNKYGKLEEVKDAAGKLIKTSPKIPSEDWELEELAKQSPDFKLISDRMVRKHRLSTVEGYLKNVRPDGRIPMLINPCGCNTMRVRHSVVANVPRIGSFAGESLRSLFAAGPSKVLVGSDVSGLEACMLAHYLGDQGFIDFIIREDFKYHKYFYNILKDYVSSYDICKNLDFAFIFGGGDVKLGSMCDLIKDKRNLKSLGAEVRRVMMREVPGLEKLQKDLEQQYERTGGIIGLDGRFIKCRKKSALINTLCQSGGAIVAKVWTCRSYQQICDRYQFTVQKEGTANNTNIQRPIIFYHDEIIWETPTESARDIGDLLVQSIQWAGQYLKLKLPLTGTYKVGESWAQVH